jgi:hypothetical protein
VEHGGDVRYVHVLELRRRIDDLRVRVGLSAFEWTDASLVTATTPTKAIHVTELRAALNAVYLAVGRNAPIYGNVVKMPYASGAVRRR